MSGFQRIFIANRGEVAARIARSCDRLGITPVFGVSLADKDASYTSGRETVVLGPARASESYLNLERIVQAARQSACSALHPGWGFLSENPRLASLCEAHGVTFIGPSAKAMHLMGQKTPAKKAMASAGLKLIPGSNGPLKDLEEARTVAAEVGYPILLKAESGGGGRGMRIARQAAEIEAAYTDARAEAEGAFGDPRIYLEKLVEHSRHVEIQLLADGYGHVVHLGARDCTVQRHHQKLIEESPAIVVPPRELEASLDRARDAAQSIGYRGAGTMEFLLDQAGELRFMEMNTRLQVEHTVSEILSGTDLVEQQIRIAEGHRLAIPAPGPQLSGHAIECRINAEDPHDGFRPSPGRIERFAPPQGDHIRVDTHVSSGYEVPPFYDSLIAKLIVHGTDRQDAIDKMIQALDVFQVEGIHTTIPLHLSVLRSEEFRSNQHTSSELPGWQPPASQGD